MKRLFMGIATVAIVASAAHAQAPFADVPQDHWAYQAVNTLAQRGLVIGYPDGTFGGKRAMTRYEFAVVIARMIPQLETYIKDQVSGIKPAEPIDTSNFATKDQLNGLVSKDDFDTLKKLVDQFAPELQMLQVDVAGVKKDLADVTRRVGILEDEVSRVKVTGELTAMSRMSAVKRDTLTNGVVYTPNADNWSGAPTDIDGRPLNHTDNLLEASQMLYNMQLGITGRVTKSIKANTVLNIGNYMGGFSAAPSVPGLPGFDRGVFPYGSATKGSLNAEISPLKVYIEAPISFGRGEIALEAGKTGVQFTPYTLKLVDYDSYTNITSTDNGEVVFTGLKGKFRIGGIGFTAYGGTHGTSYLTGGPNTSGTFASGSGYPLFITGGTYSPTSPFAYDGGNAILTAPEALYGPRGSNIQGLPYLFAPITQSAGIHATVGTPYGGTLGLTLISAGINETDLTGTALPGINAMDIGRGSIYGADLGLNLFRGIGLKAEYSNSNLFQRGSKFNLNNDNSAFMKSNLHAAYDARANFAIRAIALTAGYKRVEPFFGAPGAWGSIGSWKNPTNIEGPVGTIGIPLAKGLAFSGEAAQYKSIVAGVAGPGGDVLDKDRGTKITHWNAGLKFDLTSTNKVDLGVESVRYRPNDIINATGATAVQTYYNLGYGTTLSDNASFKLLYQIIDYRDKGANLLNNGQDTRGSVAVGQFTVKF
ncbi:MAG TPA: S-layer homology domain-containing protein [Armatimonadota bacterium]|jgi:hypothetical protein